MTTATFYPDADPETTCCDGQTSRVMVSESWAVFQAATANYTGDHDESGGVGFLSGVTTDSWRSIWRSGFTFNLSTEIPVNATIINASLRLNISSKGDHFGHNPSYTVVSFSPTSATSLANNDHLRYGTTCLSNTVAFDDLPTTGPQSFTLNTTGEDYIFSHIGGVVSLGVRDYTHDVLNSEPTWSSFEETSFVHYYADKAGEANHPQLTVNYLMPLLDIDII